MKIIFAGTPEFASIVLETLIQSKHEVVAVYTQPDRPAGRGLKLKVSPVKELAKLYKLSLHQPATLKDEHEQSVMAAYHADAIVVTAYGLLLPTEVLHLTPHGCINIHPSLLPRWRGAAPIQRAIQEGDKVTGVSIMQMDEGLDTGPLLSQVRYVLDPYETSQTLHDELARLGAETLISTLNEIEAGNKNIKPQDNANATYAHKITKEEALIDWLLPAIEIEHQIRAFNPWPVAYTTWEGTTLRIWFAKAITQDHTGLPRTILNASPNGIDVATGKGMLRILKVQLPGSKVLSVSDFYNAHHDKLIVGQHLL